MPAALPAAVVHSFSSRQPSQYYNMVPAQASLLLLFTTLGFTSGLPRPAPPLPSDMEILAALLDQYDEPILSQQLYESLYPEPSLLEREEELVMPHQLESLLESQRAAKKQPSDSQHKSGRRKRSIPVVPPYIGTLRRKQ